jgi:uncharacterized protein (DUF302 family)
VMQTQTQTNASRVVVKSSNPFESVLTTLAGAVGRPNTPTFLKQIEMASTYAEMETIIKNAEGPSGLIEFARFDLGWILRKETGKTGPQSVRLLIGNPLVMKEMLKHVPDAGSYAPATVLVDERPDGVYLSYDRIAAFLAPYGSASALQVAQDLDLKVERILRQAAG